MTKKTKKDKPTKAKKDKKKAPPPSVVVLPEAVLQPPGTEAPPPQRIRSLSFRVSHDVFWEFARLSRAHRLKKQDLFMLCFETFKKTTQEPTR